MPIYSRKKPTGFSSAHQIGLLFSMIRRQAITIFNPACGSRFRASALQFKTENSVQGGGGKNTIYIVRRLICKYVVGWKGDISDIISRCCVGFRPATATTAKVKNDFGIPCSFVDVAQACVSSLPLMSSHTILITVLVSLRRLTMATILVLSAPFGVSASTRSSAL